MKKTIRMAHINIRSILPKLNELYNIIIDNSFDIFAVTETWLGTHVPEESINLDEFAFVRRDRDGRGGGVGVFLRGFIKYSVLDVSSNIEQLWLGLEINKFKLVIGIVYRPPTLDYK